MTLKKVKWVDIQDTSGPKLKSSTKASNEFPEEVLVKKLQMELNGWLSEMKGYLPLDAGAVQASHLHAELGVGRFAKVVIADLHPADCGDTAPTTVALKISTFANAPTNIAQEVKYHIPILPTSLEHQIMPFMYNLKGGGRPSRGIAFVAARDESTGSHVSCRVLKLGENSRGLFKTSTYDCTGALYGRQPNSVCQSS